MHPVFSTVLLGLILSGNFISRDDRNEAGNTLVRSALRGVSTDTCPSGLEWSQWIFGIQGGLHLDFRNGKPEEFLPTGINTHEASVIVCDAAGELLFYSEGRHVFNRNHEFMQPVLPVLLGSHSATHIMALPIPGRPDEYYLFYNRGLRNPEATQDTTLYHWYARIDMRLNGGLGGLSERNVLLAEYMTEKFAATRHCNGRDWWLLSYSYALRAFMAWLITGDGIQPPVISAVGNGIGRHYVNKAGEINFSPDGTMIAMGTTDFEQTGEGGLELFKFDLVNGVVFDPILVHTGGTLYYGIEFSSDDQLLYALYRPGPNVLQAIAQYSLEHYDAAAIRTSEIIIDPGYDPHGALATAYDGKIYIANRSHYSLSVIHRPDVRGLGCGLVLSGLPLQHGRSFVGLPSMPNGAHKPQQPYLRGPRTVCDTVQQVQVYIAGNCAPYDQEWSLHGGSTVLAQQGDTLWLQPGSPGIDTIVVWRHTACRSVSDTLLLHVLSCADPEPCATEFSWLHADTATCPGSAFVLRYHTNATHVSLHNAAGVLVQQALTPSPGTGTLDIYPAPLPGQYTLRLHHYNGCAADSIIPVTIYAAPHFAFSWDSTEPLICTGSTAQWLYTTGSTAGAELLTAGGDLIAADPVSPLSIGPLYSDTSFLLRLTQGSCDTLIPIHITVEHAGPTSHDTVTLCAGDSVLLWDTWVQEDGVHTRVYDRDSGCDSTSTVVVSLLPLPVIETIAITDALCGSPSGQIIITATGSGDLSYAIDGGVFSASPVFSDIPAGIHTIVIRDSEGCSVTTMAEIKAIGAPVIHDVHLMHPSCGAANGTITISASAGNGPLSFALAGGSFSGSPIFSGLVAGSYIVQIQDSAGCAGSAMVMLTSTDAPVITDITTENAHCDLHDGVIRITASGTGPLTYSINGSTPGSSAVVEGLPPGTYTVTVSDTAGCTTETQVRIDEIPAILIEAVEVAPATCGDHNGRIGIFPSQTADVAYSLDRITWQSVPSFVSLHGGMYTVYLRSYGVCIDSAVAEIPMHNAPSIVGISVTAADCHGDNGIAGVIIDGGTPPLIYTLEGHPAATPPFTGLAPGNYILTVHDANGCSANATFTVPIEESLSITSIAITPARCASQSGSIEMHVSRTDVEYLLDGTLLNTTGHFTGLTSGDHHLLLRDSDDCTLDTVIHIPSLDCGIFLPNVFTPNGDGINDTFGPVSADAQLIIHTFAIFDRWGNAVYSCSGGTCAWDGRVRNTDAPAGVYIYHLVFITESGERMERKGSVTVLR